MSKSILNKGHYVICDRCGLKKRLKDVRREWTGLIVCKKDWDRKHPSLLPYRERVIKPHPIQRPELPDVTRADTDNGLSSL